MAHVLFLLSEHNFAEEKQFAMKGRGGSSCRLDPNQLVISYKKLNVCMLLHLLNLSIPSQLQEHKSY